MDISLSSDALDISFHPNENVHWLAVGLINGKVQLIDYSPLASLSSTESKDASQKLHRRVWSHRISRKSCRGVTFNKEGNRIYAIFKDRSLVALDTETGEVVHRIENAHDSAPSRILSIDSNLIATGDDDGMIRVWDMANAKESAHAIQTYDHHTDWITDMLWCDNLDAPRQNSKETQKRKRDAKQEQVARSRLVCTSGDGTLSVINIRAKKNGVEVSEDQEDELLSAAAIKRGKKLVIGTQLGILSLWVSSRGLLDHVDRFPGHPASVDAICTLDDDTILTGSSDGLIRVVQLFPHKLLGVVADHDGMPVEVIRRKGNFVASLGHASECKLTDLRPLLEGDDEADLDQSNVIQVEVPGATRSTEVSDGSDSSDDNHDDQDQEERRQRDRVISTAPTNSSTNMDQDAKDFFADL
ncbi:hypothetical protein MYAM1_001349 [Malassezia yamatoensis]|uniref:WD repeat-containing protein JIP5 n=1 Tax=Malassezia yamatoensis TaxID=253288 RepID=A0AAJ5YY66_9BASI|nr:hypothetical protein MYAM1_001349 [Malassezia yamatoensis]